MNSNVLQILRPREKFILREKNFATEEKPEEKSKLYLHLQYSQHQNILLIVMSKAFWVLKVPLFVSTMAVHSEKFAFYVYVMCTFIIPTCKRTRMLP